MSKFQQPPRPQADRAQPSCRVILRGSELRLPLDVFTLEGFRAWAQSGDSPDKAKLTFLNGQVVIDIGGEEIQACTLVKTAVCVPLGQIVRQEDLGIFSIGGALVSNVPADVSNIPDAALVTWDSLEAGRARLVQDPEHPERYREIEGTPDWVLEIVSDSSVGKDTRDLVTAYHQAGIREYWLIDARGEEIRFTIFLHQPAGYAPAPQRGGWQRSQVFNRRFRLVRSRGRMGLWRYALEVRPARSR
jgi:Uma2 family endonuclease